MQIKLNEHLGHCTKCPKTWKTKKVRTTSLLHQTQIFSLSGCQQIEVYKKYCFIVRINKSSSGSAGNFLGLSFLGPGLPVLSAWFVCVNKPEPDHAILWLWHQRWKWATVCQQPHTTLNQRAHPASFSMCWCCCLTVSCLSTPLLQAISFFQKFCRLFCSWKTSPVRRASSS